MCFYFFSHYLVEKPTNWLKVPMEVIVWAFIHTGALSQLTTISSFCDGTDIVEKEPLMNRFISPSSELLDQAGHSQLNCAFFSAGLIEQFLRDVGLVCFQCYCVRGPGVFQCFFLFFHTLSRLCSTVVRRTAK